MRSIPHTLLHASLAVSVVLAAGCSSRSLTNAPVEDRGTSASRQLPGNTPASVDASGVKQLPGFENAGKPGYYTVKPGDTLIRIGLDAGQNFRDLVRWNNLENPNLIEVGQVLRIVPPSSDNPLVVTRPVTSGTAATTTAAIPVRPATAASAPGAAGNPQPASTEDDIAWIWPAQGKLIAGFDEVKNKGYDIDGKTGDPIIAAGDGRVVYAGAGLHPAQYGSACHPA